MRWSVPRHDAARARLLSILGDRERTGAILIGPDGAGKTTLARTVADEHLRRRPDGVARWVTGTPTERSIPLGAFSHLVSVTDVGKPAALLRAARESLHTNTSDILVVDAAHQLDPLSATLVYQLALARTTMLVTASRSGAPAPITALLTDSALDLVEIEGIGTPPQDVDRYFAGLPTTAREALEMLVIQEPLAVEHLSALLGAPAVDEAVALGAIEIETRSGKQQLAYITDPQFGERARRELTEDAAERIRSQLVPLVAATVDDHPVARLRLAALAGGSSVPLSVETTVAAANEALRMGAVGLAERLARGAVDRSGGTPARLALAQALAWQGRGRDAETVLDAMPTDGLDDSELMAVALPRAANQFWMLGQPERATAYLLNTRNRVADPAAKTTIDALSATFAMNAGAPNRALEIAEQVLTTAAADDVAVAWAASAACLCSARACRLDDVEPLARRAFAAEHPGLLRFTVGLGQVTALLMAAQLTEAAHTARRYTDFSESLQPGRAIGDVLVAHVLMTAGRDAEAAELLSPAATVLDRTGYSWGPLALTLWATALSRAGELAEAAKVLQRAESRHGTKSALFAPELGVARAWRLAAARDQPGSIQAARQAARMAERAGQSAVAVTAWHDAVRLGDVHAGSPLERLNSEVGCVRAHLALSHSRALASGNPAALTAVATELAEAGLLGAAADASAQAASA